MRCLSSIALGLLIGVAAPAYAQSPAADAQAPAPQTPPAATPDEESAGSLFDIAPNQVLFGARVSSIDGDPARWQRVPWSCSIPALGTRATTSSSGFLGSACCSAGA